MFDYEKSQIKELESMAKVSGRTPEQLESMDIVQYYYLYQSHIELIKEQEERQKEANK